MVKGWFLWFSKSFLRISSYSTKTFRFVNCNIFRRILFNHISLLPVSNTVSNWLINGRNISDSQYCLVGLCQRYFSANQRDDWHWRSSSTILENWLNIRSSGNKNIFLRIFLNFADFLPAWKIITWKKCIIKTSSCRTRLFLVHFGNLVDQNAC